MHGEYQIGVAVSSAVFREATFAATLPSVNTRAGGGGSAEADPESQGATRGATLRARSWARAAGRPLRGEGGPGPRGPQSWERQPPSPATTASAPPSPEGGPTHPGDRDVRLRGPDTNQTLLEPVTDPQPRTEQRTEAPLPGSLPGRPSLPPTPTPKSRTPTRPL